jgi:hypothetical protein
MSEVEPAAPAPPPKRGMVANLLPDDWPVQAADAVERVVDGVRAKTTGPAIVVSRVVVYGLVATVLGIVAFVLALVGFVRALDVILPRGVWLAYLVLGTIFLLAGLVVWRKRVPRT